MTVGPFERIRRAIAGRRQRSSGRPEPPDWSATVRRRLRIAAIVLGGWAVVIQGRLVYVQVVDRADLEERARDQHENEIKTLPLRGDIIDRNGNKLATSADLDSFYVDPSQITKPEAAVKALCGALQDCTPEIRKSLLERFGKKNQFAWVKRRATPEQSQRIKDLKLKFVYLKPESVRSYPNGELAAHVIGWVSAENEGQGGLEYAYNQQIRGVEGKAITLNDAHQVQFGRVDVPPVQGSTLELTIDEYLQHIAQRELHAAVVSTRAVGGTVVIMRPSTGEILTMANEPTFDPNFANKASKIQQRNRAIQDAYEPGSTFKLVTASAALEEGLIRPDAMIETSPGYIQVRGGVYHDTVNHGTLSFADVIADSSNVGAIKVAQRVGRDRLFKFVNRFGFGKRVSSDFRGENPGKVWALEDWTEMALASTAIGYQVGVTPLQLVTAVSAIANGGTYIEPRIVGAMYANNRRQAVRPNIVRQAVSPETAAVLTGIMEGAVAHGTATRAQIPGFTIAGKTGTAAKIVNGRYSKTDYNASFVGFLPSNQPELAIVVVIDNPRGDYYGGLVSAPVFQRIAVAAIRHLGIAPTLNPAPPVLLARADHETTLPIPPSIKNPAPQMKLIVDTPDGTVPDVIGLTGREASLILVRNGLKSPVVDGDGFVVSQTPLPGTPVEPGAVSRLVLARTADLLAGAQVR